MQRRVWDLLASAQTVESLARGLARDFGNTTNAEVKVTLQELLDQDAVELSPDS